MDRLSKHIVYTHSLTATFIEGLDSRVKLFNGDSHLCSLILVYYPILALKEKQYALNELSCSLRRYKNLNKKA